MFAAMAGGAAIPAYHMDRLRMAEYTGERIVQLVKDHVTARQILTLDAIENGVSRVHILDGRIAHCLLLEIFTNQGMGTAIIADKDKANMA